jgi:hypothetical protein
MASVLRTTEADILLAVKARIVASVTISGTAIAANRVLIVARDSVPHFSANHDFLIRGGDAQNAEAEFDGMGRYATTVEQIIEITVRTRMMLDQADRDTDWLTTASTGHAATCHSLIGALHKWTAVADANLLMSSPMRFTRWGKPKREAKRDTPRGWGERVLSFSVRYLLNLDTSVE